MWIDEILIMTEIFHLIMIPTKLIDQSISTLDYQY